MIHDDLQVLRREMWASFVEIIFLHDNESYLNFWLQMSQAFKTEELIVWLVQLNAYLSKSIKYVLFE